ncbi:hypothetical protein [Kitasatospora aureofaciens]|uniref:hypothetical protein n=1 Tax=Kitasatospora aureofaciens TaxID=1894 RepID=UPI0037CB3476
MASHFVYSARRGQAVVERGSARQPSGGFPMGHTPPGIPAAGFRAADERHPASAGRPCGWTGCQYVAGPGWQLIDCRQVLPGVFGGVVVVDGADGCDGVDDCDDCDGADGCDGIDGWDGWDGWDGVDGSDGVVDGVDDCDDCDGVDGCDGATEVVPCEGPDDF